MSGWPSKRPMSASGIMIWMTDYMEVQQGHNVRDWATNEAKPITFEAALNADASRRILSMVRELSASRVASTEFPYRTEFRIPRPDGSHVWFESAWPCAF